MVLAHVEDVARAVEKSIDWKEVPAPVTAAHHRQIDFIDILRTIARNQGRTLRTVSIPSRLGLRGLRSVEAFGVTFGFRSDSLESMLHPNPACDFDLPNKLGLAFRDFLDVNPAALE